jgi:hypothetical protein
MMRAAMGSLLLVVVFAPVAAAASAVGVDVRLVVDVSGSMKSGDPEYLRQDVLNDLVEALPKGSRAGIWTFGSTANNVVPHGAIDDRWRRAARAARANIVSAAPLTNLRDALARAAWDADAPSPNWDRHILLVTDGRIDVGRDATQNERQRRAIVDEWLPRLRAVGIRLDSLVLSSDADLKFLTMLADATDGRAERADTVAAVKDFVARTYAAATPRWGAFTVAADVDELTVFAPGAEALSLVTPRGDTIDAAHAMAGVRWFAASAGTVATLTAPAAGRWRYAPDTRPMDLYSDLGVDVRANGPAEVPTLHVTLVDAGRPVAAALRDLVSLDAALTTLYRTDALPVTPDPQTAAFDVALGSPLTADDEVALRLVGPTFERARAYAETIAHPIDVDLHDAGDGTATARVQVNLAAVDRTTLRVLATTAVAGGSRTTLGVGEKQADGTWTVGVPALAANVELRLKVLFNDVDGTDTTIEADSIELGLPLAKSRRVGFDEHGRTVADPVRTPPFAAPIDTAAAPPDQPPIAPAATEAARAEQPPVASPTSRMPRLWEWLAMLVVAFACVGSLAWFVLRRRIGEPDTAFDATLQAYREALSSATAKPRTATTT